MSRLKRTPSDKGIRQLREIERELASIRAALASLGGGGGNAAGLEFELERPLPLAVIRLIEDRVESLEAAVAALTVSSPLDLEFQLERGVTRNTILDIQNTSQGIRDDLDRHDFEQVKI